MEKRIDILTFGTFGNPFGFTQTIKNISKDNRVISVKALDINTNALKLFADTEMYSIRKDLVANSKSIAFSKYVFVKEKNSTRGGTFIGSSILFTNGISNEIYTLKILNDFCSKLIQDNTVNNTMSTDHSDKFILPKEFNFEGLIHPSEFTNKITDWRINNKYLVHYCVTKDLQALSETIMYSIELLNFYDCIYFTSSEEIAKYVNDKNIYELSANKSILESKLLKFHQENENRILQSINQLKNEIESFVIIQKEKITNIENESIRLKSIHSENQKKIDKQEGNRNKFQAEFQSLKNRSNKLLEELNSGRSIDEVKKLAIENQRSFSEKTNKIASFSTLESLSPREVTHRESNPINQNLDQNYSNPNRSRKNKSYLDQLLSIGLILLGLILIIVVIRIIFPKDDKTSLLTTNHNKHKVHIKDFNDSTYTFIEPVNKLSVKDLEYTNKLIEVSNQKDLDIIINIIFKANPSDIDKHYKDFRDQYKTELLEKNIECFDDSNILIRPLVEIPCFKK